MKKILLSSAFCFLLSVLLIPIQSFAQVYSHGNTVSAPNNTNLFFSFTMDISVPASDKVVLVINCLSNQHQTINTIKFNGITYNSNSIGVAINSNIRLGTWVIPLGDISTPLTNETITINLTSFSNIWAATATTYYNVDQGTPANNFTDNKELSIDVNSNPGDMVVDAIFSGSTPNLSADVSQTEISAVDAYESYPNLLIMYSSQKLSSSTSTNMNWANNATVSTLTHSAYNLQSAGTLPVELISFRGQSTPEGTALMWTTATEENNEGFKVEHSSDGKEWHKLDFVDGHGNTLEEQSYTYLHREVSTGLNYYRLKQVDFDGKFEYSDVIGVEVKDKAGKVNALYPNPTYTGLVQMDYMAQEEGETAISVFDVTGQLVMQRMVAVNGGQNNLSFDFSELSAGLYMVRVGNTGKPIQLVVQ